MEDLSKELKHLIANNKIDQALELLLKEGETRGGDLQQVVIGLSNRYQRYKKKAAMGLEENEQDLSHIIFDALETINILDDPNFEQKKPAVELPKTVTDFRGKEAPLTASSSRKYLPFVFGGIALVVLGFIFLNPFGSSDYDPIEQDLSGKWVQVSDPDDGIDCIDCYITVYEFNDADKLELTGGDPVWKASLSWDDDSKIFYGTVNWGLAAPDATDHNLTLYMKEETLYLENEDFTMAYLRR